MVRKSKQQKDTTVVEVDEQKPQKAREEGVWYDLPISAGKWNVRDALNIEFKFPKTLQDIGIQSTATVLTTMIDEWGEASGKHRWIPKSNKTDFSSPLNVMAIY
eukprot:2628677-Rhodomonas_salina.1